jgi:hypothetical protein
MYYSRDKDISRLVKELVNKGWVYSRTKKHGKLLSPVGDFFVVSITPSSNENLMNLRKIVKRL